MWVLSVAREKFFNKIVSGDLINYRIVGNKLLDSPSTSNKVDGRIPYGDFQKYSANGYTAFASAWSTFPGNANDDLTSPDDYKDTIWIDVDQFPNNTRIQTRWPIPGPGTISGYYFVAGPDYDDDDPSSWPHWQVGNLVEFTETFNISVVQGASEDYIVLNEFYLTLGPGSTLTKLYEIAHWGHIDEENIDYYEAGALLGEYTDAQSRIWEVRNAGANPVGADYIIFLLKSRADLLNATLDKKAELFWLRDTAGLSINHLYVNSPAFGIETFRSVVIVELVSYSYEFSGSGEVIPAPPSNLLTNGDFSTADAGWSGFWYAGKTVDYGNLRAVFDAGSVAYDGLAQSIEFTPGKYYQYEFTQNRTAGGMRVSFNGGTQRDGATHSTSDTFKARLLANTGNNQFYITPTDPPFQGWLDDVKLTGPWDTNIVDGS